ncbi:MAG: aspartyl protease family protein [Euryarchaeota archaeon]|nr:aspartyl protease family protein [Euryarchaeota archaeon]
MPRTTPLLKFSFNYSDFECKIPVVPVRFIREDGTSSALIYAVLDSGAEGIVLREDLAQWLKLKLTPKQTPALTAGGQKQCLTGTVPVFILGRGGREIRYENIEVIVIEGNPAILIGINPIFEDYIVTINSHAKKFLLDPRK